MAIDKEIPTIDISPYLDPTSPPEAKANVVEQVKNACSHYGFLQVVGHGVPLQAQRAVLRSCKTFFDLPMEHKDALLLKNSRAGHGYEKLGEQTLDKKALPDDKEGIYIGKDVSCYMGFRQGPNQWPDLPREAFRDPVMEYYDHVLKLAYALMEMLVVGLGHQVEVLKAFTHDPVQTVKLLHYPPHSSEDAQQFGAGQHTDFGAITILLQQPEKHGLQVYYAPDDEWVDVPAKEDVLVINMGDLVQKWTHGEYKSTLHRVINAARDDRYSVPCFYEGDMKATNPFDPSSEDRETVEEHIKKKLAASYAGR